MRAGLSAERYTQGVFGLGSILRQLRGTRRILGGSGEHLTRTEILDLERREEAAEGRTMILAAVLLSLFWVGLILAAYFGGYTGLIWLLLGMTALGLLLAWALTRKRAPYPARRALRRRLRRHLNAEASQPDVWDELEDRERR